MNKAQKESPAAATNGARQQSSTSKHDYSRLPISKLEAAVRGFQRTGKDQGVFCCTAHDDRNPSACWRELPDGKLLIFCQAGCETADVLASAGLTLADLFPDNDRNHGRPIPPSQRWDYRALLGVLRRETTLVYVCATDIANGRALTDDDRERLLQAARRINRVAEVAT